jgi:hypothetical protein
MIAFAPTAALLSPPVAASPPAGAPRPAGSQEAPIDAAFAATGGPPQRDTDAEAIAGAGRVYIWELLLIVFGAAAVTLVAAMNKDDLKRGAALLLPSVFAPPPSQHRGAHTSTSAGGGPSSMDPLLGGGSDVAVACARAGLPVAALPALFCTVCGVTPAQLRAAGVRTRPDFAAALGLCSDAETARTLAALAAPLSELSRTGAGAGAADSAAAAVDTDVGTAAVPVPGPQVQFRLPTTPAAAAALASAAKQQSSRRQQSQQQQQQQQPGELALEYEAFVDRFCRLHELSALPLRALAAEADAIRIRLCSLVDTHAEIVSKLTVTSDAAPGAASAPASGFDSATAATLKSVLASSLGAEERRLRAELALVERLATHRAATAVLSVQAAINSVGDRTIAAGARLTPAPTEPAAAPDAGADAVGAVPASAAPLPPALPSGGNAVLLRSAFDHLQGRFQPLRPPPPVAAAVEAERRAALASAFDSAGFTQQHAGAAGADAGSAAAAAAAAAREVAACDAVRAVASLRGDLAAAAALRVALVGNAAAAAPDAVDARVRELKQSPAVTSSSAAVAKPAAAGDCSLRGAFSATGDARWPLHAQPQPHTAAVCATAPSAAAAAAAAEAADLAASVPARRRREAAYLGRLSPPSVVAPSPSAAAAAGGPVFTAVASALGYPAAAGGESWGRWAGRLLWGQNAYPSEPVQVPAADTALVPADPAGAAAAAEGAAATLGAVTVGADPIVGARALIKAARAFAVAPVAAAAAGSGSAADSAVDAGPGGASAFAWVGLPSGASSSVEPLWVSAAADFLRGCAPANALDGRQRAAGATEDAARADAVAVALGSAQARPSGAVVSVYVSRLDGRIDELVYRLALAELNADTVWAPRANA